MDLRTERCATVDCLDETPLGAPERDENLLDLLGEFACGHEDEAGWAMRGGLADSHHHWNSKAEGLARTSGRTATQILAGEGVGEGDGLNRERFCDAISGECFDKARGDAKICK